MSAGVISARPTLRSDGLTIRDECLEALCDAEFGVKDDEPGKKGRDDERFCQLVRVGTGGTGTAHLNDSGRIS